MTGLEQEYQEVSQVLTCDGDMDSRMAHASQASAQLTSEQRS